MVFVGADFPETLGIPLRAGRAIGPAMSPARRGRDGERNVRSDISRRARRSAHRFGVRFRRSPSSAYEIVGVLADAHFHDPSGRSMPMAFLPLLQEATQFALQAEAIVRTKGNRRAGERSPARARRRRRQSAGNDPRPLREQVDRQFRSSRLAARLVGLFGAGGAGARVGRAVRRRVAGGRCGGRRDRRAAGARRAARATCCGWCSATQLCSSPLASRRRADFLRRRASDCEPVVRPGRGRRRRRSAGSACVLIASWRRTAVGAGAAGVARRSDVRAPLRVAVAARGKATATTAKSAAMSWLCVLSAFSGCSAGSEAACSGLAEFPLNRKISAFSASLRVLTARGRVS